MGQKKVKFSIFPQFHSKKSQKTHTHTHTHLVWGFFTFQCFAFFLIFAFSSLSFSAFPLLLDFLKPKSGPSNEVIGMHGMHYWLGGNFGPEKKIFSSPPHSPIPHRHPPGRTPPPLENPPPLLGLSIKNRTRLPPPGASDSPIPSPRPKKLSETSTKLIWKHFLNSVQTRCIVKGEVQKSPLFWRFSGVFWRPEQCLLSKNFTRNPLNWKKINIQTPLVNPLFCAMPLVCTLLIF